MLLEALATPIGDPSLKTARHTTSVPLYSDLAGMDNVYTTVPFSMINPVVMSGNALTGDNTFILQPIIAPGDV